MKKFFSVISVIALLFIMCIPAFASAPESLPPFPSAPAGTNDYVDLVVYDGTSTYLHRLSSARSTVTFTAERNTSKQTVTYTGSSDDSVGYTKYLLTSDYTWHQESYHTYSDASSIWFTVDCATGTLGSNKVIKDETGGDFFYPTQGLSAGAVMALANRALTMEVKGIGRTASILILCGVGCLALLISAPLLLKVLRNFRV